MKLFKFLAIALLLIACKQTPKNAPVSNEHEMSENLKEEVKCPASLQKVFNAHGLLVNWKKQRTLTFSLAKPSGVETHTTDLWSRKDKIETDNYALGYNGKNVWLLDSDDSYKGNAVFYHNLMFYFAAMPFVLADEGIIYSEVEPITFNNTTYPGIKIAYNNGVGSSPEDEYYIYYHPDTFKMEWLGYTVTFFSGNKEKEIHWLKYDDWVETNGLLLPSKLTWYSTENNKIGKVASSAILQDIVLDNVAKPKDYYNLPEGAKIIE